MNEELHPDTPDIPALQRRVLAVGLLSLVLFFTAVALITVLDLPSWVLVIVVVALYLGVIRPLMAPAVAALKLRRRLAYQAFLDQRPDRER